jgi:hypothetical protein
MRIFYFIKIMFQFLPIALPLELGALQIPFFTSIYHNKFLLMDVTCFMWFLMSAIKTKRKPLKIYYICQCNK